MAGSLALQTTLLLSHPGPSFKTCFFLLWQQIDFPNSDLFQPCIRHSYSKNDLERLLALETDDYRIGGPIPDDEQVMSV